MNTQHKAFLALVALSCLAAAASAQTYSITSFTIEGGGGTSSGTGAAGTFSVSGAIAQHDANATSTGGSDSLSGGFFGQYMALQQTGAPHVIIRGVGANVEVVWAANVPGWVLQSNTSELSPTGWVDVVGTPTVNGAEQILQFAAGSGRLFFRLRKL